MGKDGKPKPDEINLAISGTDLDDRRSPKDGPARDALQRVDRVALTLARIIGRRMAREDFAARHKANDPGPAREGPKRDEDE